MVRIATGVRKALEELRIGDLEEAHFEICAAIEATAKDEYGKGDRETYKKFIVQNLSIISGGHFPGVGFTFAFGLPGTSGPTSLEDIAYHAFR
jgi:hypothetical protein